MGFAESKQCRIIVSFQDSEVKLHLHVGLESLQLLSQSLDLNVGKNLQATLADCSTGSLGALLLAKKGLHGCAQGHHSYRILITETSATQILLTGPIQVNMAAEIVSPSTSVTSTMLESVDHWTPLIAG